MPDPDIAQNLDAMSRRFREAQAAAQAALDGQPTPYEPLLPSQVGAGGYEDLTTFHEELRKAQGWSEPDLEAALTPAMRSQLEAIRAHQRVPWNRADFASVGLAALIGALAALFDDQLSGMVGSGLQALQRTELVRGWERAAHGLPIDYQGPGFGGGAHRIRSAGHDMGRPFEALRQIRSGQFAGVRYGYGVASSVSSSVNQYGTPYQPVPQLADAIVVLLKHWGSDLVTPMGLPLPGFTKLAELPIRPIREFVNKTYAGQWKGYKSGPGLNTTWAASQTLPVLATEIILRTNAHVAAYSHRGDFTLSPAEKAKLRETLAVAYGLSLAMSTSKTVVMAIAGEGPLALRHVNFASLIRCSMCSYQVVRDSRTRSALNPPTWDELLASKVQNTWTADLETMLAQR